MISSRPQGTITAGSGGRNPLTSLLGLVLSLGGLVAALFAIERTALRDDAAQYWMMAGRLAETGDPFYVAAVDHKGPLWVWLYRAGYFVSGDQQYFWFIMAAMVIGLALIVAWSLFRIVNRVTGLRGPAWVVAVTTAVLLCFGPELFSQVLYSRNITIALTALAVVAVVNAVMDQSSTATRWLVPAGAALGLASTTVLTTLAPTAMLALALLLLGKYRRQSFFRATVLLASAATVFAAVPLLYIWRGVGAEFRTYFWDYNQIYAADEASLVSRIGEAINVMVHAHLMHQRYLLVGLVGAVIVIARALPWSETRVDPKRRASLVLVAWWLGEGISVAAPGRYFEHYWILLAVPAAALAGVALGPSWHANARHVSGSGLRKLWATVRQSPGPSVAMMLPIALVALIAAPSFVRGAETALNFRGAAQHQQERDAEETADIAAMRGVVEALSFDDDPMFAWSPAAEAYVVLDRPAATRFDRRSWLTGQVWGSDAVAELPGVWDQAVTDLLVSEPRLVVELTDEPMEPGTSLYGYVQQFYRPVYETDSSIPVRIYQRLDTSGAAVPDALALVEGGSGAGSVRCWSASSAIATGSIGLTGPEQTGSFLISETEVVSRRGAGINVAETRFDPTSERPATSSLLRLTVGPDWALLWEDGKIVGAMHLPHGIADVDLAGDAVALSVC